MKYILAALLLAIASTALADGPSLGRATYIIITEIGFDKRDGNAGICATFKPTLAEVEAFLNSAIIVTPYELHNEYNSLPCYAKGSANFRGIVGNWEMRAGGTGLVTFYGEFTYLLADPRARDSTEE